MKEVAGRAVMVAWAVAGVVAVVAPQVQILGLKKGHDSNGGLTPPRWDLVSTASLVLCWGSASKDQTNRVWGVHNPGYEWAGLWGVVSSLAVMQTGVSVKPPG